MTESLNKHKTTLEPLFKVCAEYLNSTYPELLNEADALAAEQSQVPNEEVPLKPNYPLAGLYTGKLGPAPFTRLMVPSLNAAYSSFYNPAAFAILTRSNVIPTAPFADWRGGQQGGHNPAKLAVDQIYEFYVAGIKNLKSTLKRANKALSPERRYN